MLQRVPSAMTLHPALSVGEPELSFVRCETCDCSGYVVWSGSVWAAGRPEYIRI